MTKAPTTSIFILEIEENLLFLYHNTIQDVKETGHGKNLDMVIWEEEGLSHIGISTTKTFKQEILSFVELGKH